MPGRSFTSTTQYRYGFNGKENDNEVKGTANQQDYGMRIYDPRVGRFLSMDPITRQYPWYTPYQFAGSTPIQAVDQDGAEPWLRQRVQSMSSFRNAITAVSSSVTAESGFTLSVAQGMAVDPKGNVLMFSTRGGLAALEGGISSSPGLNFAWNATYYNNKIQTLDQLLGGGSSGGYSAGWKEAFSFGWASENGADGAVGSTFSIGFGFGAMPVGASASKSITSGTILTGNEYDKVYNDRVSAVKQSINDQIEYNKQQADVAGGSYAKALYQSQAAGVDIQYVPVSIEGKKDVFEIVYTYNLWIYPNALVNGQGKDVVINKTFQTGVIVQRDPDGNYISTNYNPKQTEQESEKK